MNPRTIYKISRYSGTDDAATVLDQVQLLSVEGELRLRAADGSETLCPGADVEALITSAPSLSGIRPGRKVVISCDPELAARLPLLLKPELDGGEATDCHAEINGESWAAYRTLDEDYVMLPGDPDEEPYISPCWAEFFFEQGEWNPLQAWTSIGLVTPRVVVEYARYSHGGFGGDSAVALSPLSDFANLFVDWLVDAEVLVGVWDGDTSPESPHFLFEDAVTAADKKARWTTADEDDGDDEDDDYEDDEAYDEDDDEGSSYRAAASLSLRLSDEQIEEVRARLRSIKHTDSNNTPSR